MNAAMQATQRGLSFSGFLFGAVILVLASVVGMKVIPVYIEDVKIKHLFVAIANDPEMQNASLQEIRASYSKRMVVEDVTAVKVGDVEIAKDGSELALSASYFVIIPLVGNVSLYLDFNPSSAAD